MHSREVRELREREVDLGRRAAVPETLQICHDFLGEMLLAHQRQQRRSGVSPGDDESGSKLRSVGQGNAGGPAA